MARTQRGLTATSDDDEKIQVKFGFGLGVICNGIAADKHASKTQKNKAKRDRKRRKGR